MATPASEHDPALARLPRYQRADLYRRRLGGLAYALGGGALVLLLSARALSLFDASWLWQATLIDIGSAVLLLSVCLQDTARVALWRFAKVSSETPKSRAKARTERPTIQVFRRWAPHTKAALRPLVGFFAQEPSIIAVVAVIVLNNIVHAWRLFQVSNPPLAPAYFGGACALAAAFGLLVFERWLAAIPAAELPEGGSLARTTRIAVSVLIVSAAALLAFHAGREWVGRAALLIGILPALLAAELLLRAVGAWFVGAPATQESRQLTESLLADFFRWPPRPIHTIRESLFEHFGIDLRQNWAFSFIRRAALPIAFGLTVFAWLLTGIIEIPFDQRGIYERFGLPVRVLAPGLHVGLPWPLTRVLRVEYGVTHELATSVADQGAPAADASTAEGAAPPSADRLWDVAHVGENDQLISSVSGSKQNFQIVNMDVRFVYRIGLSDRAALAAAYGSVDLAELVRSVAGRVMVRDFASRTLDALLGQAVIALSGDLRRGVQMELDRMGCGVELLAVLIESIHPPAGAAAAYHSVQASEIGARATVARERGGAAVSLSDANRDAQLSSDKATAQAQEERLSADASKVRFDAEEQSFRAAGPAFMRERYFEQLGIGLAKANLLIIDHRIGGPGNMPTIDLRPFGAASDSYDRR